jgi:hypothetical protein
MRNFPKIKNIMVIILPFSKFFLLNNIQFHLMDLWTLQIILSSYHQNYSIEFCLNSNKINNNNNNNNNNKFNIDNNK